MPKLLLAPEQRGWPHFQRLMIALLSFLEPYLRNADLTEAIRMLYKVGSLHPMYSLPCTHDQLCLRFSILTLQIQLLYASQPVSTQSVQVVLILRLQVCTCVEGAELAARCLQGTLRVLLVLLHDFPEFLCEYHFELCNKVPPSCIQMRNLILSAFPRMMRLPDPFTPNLKVWP